MDKLFLIAVFAKDKSQEKRAHGTKDTVEPCYSCQQDFLSTEAPPEHVEIIPKKTRMEQQRQFGGVLLGEKLFSLLGLNEFFREHNLSHTTFFKNFSFKSVDLPFK